jgi:hypothetical protein
MLALGIVLLGCGLAFFLVEFFTPGTSPKPAPAKETEFNYDGTFYSLDKMRSLRFLPREDKLKAVGFITCPDERVARTAARLAGQWATENGTDPDGLLFFGTLLNTALVGGNAAAEAAVQAALLMARGFPFRDRIADVRKAAAALVASSDQDYRAAGYLLAAMAGIPDFNAQMARTLSEDPSPNARLYAACAMARAGDSAGYAHLKGLAGGDDPEMSSEAMACLAYSTAPGTDAFLASAARGKDHALAGLAKSVLMSRKQLAIINK